MIRNNLTKKQQLYIETALANPTLLDSELSVLIDTTPAQISRGKHEPEFTEAYDAALKEQGKGALKMAQAKIIELANCDSKAVALKAASYIADSNGLKAVDKVEVDATVNTIKVTIEDE